MTTLLDTDDRRKIRFLAAMSVQCRRHQAKDECTIRRESLDIAGKAIAKHIDNLVEQETWFSELEREIDKEIRRTRPARGAGTPPAGAGG